MNTIYFNELNSYEDLDLILTKKTIKAPSPKIITIDIPDGDGVLDYTEYFGEVKYNNGKITCEFSTKVPINEFQELFSKVKNKLHGKKMKVTLSEDTDYYYIGRITVDEFKSNKSIGELTVEIDTEPYKYKNAITIISDVVTSAKSIVCSNLKKSVVPTITLDGEANIVFGNYSTTRNGTFKDDNILFLEGQNIIVVTPTSGTINITIEYQERGL